MRAAEILEKLERPGIYACVWTGCIAFVETDTDGVQHQLNPDTFDRAGVLRRDRWNSVIGTGIYGPLARVSASPSSTDTRAVFTQGQTDLTRMRNGVQECSRDGITWVPARMQQAPEAQGRRTMADTPVLPTPVPKSHCGDRLKPCRKCGADVWKYIDDQDCGDWDESIFDCQHCGGRIYVELPD